MGPVGSVSQLAPPQTSQLAPAGLELFKNEYFDFEKLELKD